jgi:hypothetical protein
MGLSSLCATLRAVALGRGALVGARKSRWRRGSADNYGGFMLIEPTRNVIVEGSRFDLSAQAVIEYSAKIEKMTFA